IAARSSGSPAAGVYLWLRGSAHAAAAASTMWAGVGKSGSPAPNPMTSSPAACRAFALASTARVADSVIAPTRREMRLIPPWSRAEAAPTQSFWRDASADVADESRQMDGRSGADGDAADRPVRQVEEAGVVGEDLDHRDLQAEATLDHPHLVLLVPQHQRDRHAALPRTRRASGAVEVGLLVLRRVEVHDHVDAIDVDAAAATSVAT